MRGSALEVLRGAPKLRCLSLFTQSESGLDCSANFMDAAVVDIVKSFPALQIAHIPKQRVGSTAPVSPEWDEPWRELVVHMEGKRRKDDTPCGFCSVSITDSITAHCSECGKRSCKDQSKGCPKMTKSCIGCSRSFCLECTRRAKKPKEGALLWKCKDCKRNFCFVCKAKDFVDCSGVGCTNAVCGECVEACGGCDELHCRFCMDVDEGICLECVEEYDY